MFLTTNIREDFLDLFFHLIKDKTLEQRNSLNVFILNVKNNEFAYHDLIEILADRLHYFALSRNEIKKLKEEDKLRTLTDKAKNLLRNHLDINKKKEEKDSKNSEGGELGELLLYCFLESHLKAPKILTKLELKTSNQMYVNGADGVHLLKLNDREYQLVFGESKLNADLKQGIYNSFESLSKLLNKDGKKLEFEIDLVDSNLIKEAYDKDMYDFLKKLIFPTAKDDETTIDYSFGVFLGFNVEISELEKQMNHADFRVHLREKVIAEIEKNIDSIEYQIKKSNFNGYNFYFYIIPFSDLETKRTDIIEKLLT